MATHVTRGPFISVEVNQAELSGLHQTARNSGSLAIDLNIVQCGIIDLPLGAARMSVRARLTELRSCHVQVLI